MHSAGMRSLYLPGMAGLQLRLRQLEELLRRRAPRLAAHLAAHDGAYALGMPWHACAR